MCRWLKFYWQNAERRWGRGETKLYNRMQNFKRKYELNEERNGSYQKESNGTSREENIQYLK